MRARVLLTLLSLKKNVELLVVYLKEGSFMSFMFSCSGDILLRHRPQSTEKMSLTSKRKKVKIFVHGLDAYSCVIKNPKQKQVK